MNIRAEFDNENEGFGTSAPASDRERRPHPKANPDDPPVQFPPYGANGPLPDPYYLGLPGRTAIVQGQVFLVAMILIVQLGLITDALYELLSGRPGAIGWLVLVSAIGFVLALIVALWPRRRIERS
jgi:hypothetical protein